MTKMHFVPDLGLTLLIAASCLVLHWVTITALVDDFGTLPEGSPLVRMWRAGTRRPVRYTRWANVAICGSFGLVATALMVIFVFGGSYITLIGLTELGCAGAWLLYLLRDQAGPIHG